MAREALTVVGAVVGFWWGGPSGAALGAQVGGLVGGAVDRPDPIEGPRLSDLAVNVSTYGVPIPQLYGDQNRVAGNVIWSTGLIERQTTSSSGGKGGGQRVENYSYSMSLAVALGQGPLSRIKRIWANSKLMFDIDLVQNVPVATPEVGMTVVGSSHFGIGNVGLLEGAPFEVLRFYTGNATQQVDPTIESYEGVGDTPAYRRTAYLVIQGLQLADYGNRMPNIEVEVVAQPEIRVSAVVWDICRRAGVHAVTSSLNFSLDGYAVSRAGNAAAALRPLMAAYHFDVAEQGGQIRCVLRGGDVEATIPIEDMGARAAVNDTNKEPIRYETTSAIRMPRQVSVSYADPQLDYQTNTQRASRASGTDENNIQLEIPLVMGANLARQIADRQLWESWTSQRKARFSVSDKWVWLSPAKVVGIPIGDNIIPHRLVNITRGHDGVIEIEATNEDREAYLSGAFGTAGDIPDNEMQVPGETRLVLMDTPILRDQDDDAGFYWAATAEEPGWRGGVLERSQDAGETYNTVGPIEVRAVIGDVATALPAGPADIWDRGNSLTVVLHFAQDELSGLSELAVLNGGNAAWLGPEDGQGGEIIQFANAELVAPLTYELSGLLRGRRGTEHNIGSHGPNEIFVFLQSDTVRRQNHGRNDLDKSRVYRPVSNFTLPEDSPTQTFTNSGAGLRPFSPVHVGGERDGSNNLTITWFRRTRLSAPGLGRGLTPLGETAELYQVEILSGMTVVRTLDSTTTNVEYTAAQQTSDGLTPGDPVSVVVYQVTELDDTSVGTAATV